ncbi:hypothetical protein SEA_NORM_72 [Mycobacterium phage Norm]|nr:hypothetical protein SEA_NORM_72 [Mycobacterium phage Norm]
MVVTEEESRDYGSGAPSPSLETIATMWLETDRRMYTAVHGKSNGPVFGILLPDQLRMRYEREVYNRNGVADPAIESGIYHRAYNPPDRPPAHAQVRPLLRAVRLRRPRRDGRQPRRLV